MLGKGSRIRKKRRYREEITRDKSKQVSKVKHEPRLESWLLS